MAIYVVLAEKANPALEAKIVEQYPDDKHYKINDQQWLLSDDKLLNTISTNLNIPDGPMGRAAVFRVSGTGAGWHKTTLWEWVNLHTKEG